nr:NADH dehydrogenase subunit 5 [Cerodontha fulvipes]
MCNIFFFSLFFLSLSLFFSGLYFLCTNLVLFLEWDLVSINSTSFVMTILLDWMSLLFMSFVLMISSTVILYSKEYMYGDIYINRFIMLVLLFVFSMMMLIISPNLISILLGWDGLGLVSYCLVIYYQNIKSFNAGMLTVLSNRIGDIAILLAIAWMLNFGSWNFIYYLNYLMFDNNMMIIGLLIIIAAMTKSAQIPFSSWLPAAMAAPTPVSALVHSSTLVTAGVYLLIRFNILMNYWLGSFLLLISGLTMFMSGLGANFEFDLKKIIALSTLSQLGLMMSILSLGYYKLAFFHLLTHALFKALLFMCAGSIIHNMQNSQDIRMMGGLSMFMPYTTSCFNVANLALCGMPFLAGFYSKDLILEMVSASSINMLSFFLFFFSTGLTVSYSFRLIYYTMTGDLNCSALNFLNDEGWIMMKSMIILLIMSLIGGSLLNWLLFSVPMILILPFYLKMLTPIVCLGGGLFGYMISNVSLLFTNKSYVNMNMVYFMGSMWFMPFLSTYGIIFYPLKFSLVNIKSIDQGWLESLGTSQIIKVSYSTSNFINTLENNNLKIYLLSFVLWVTVFIFILFCT